MSLPEVEICGGAVWVTLGANKGLFEDMDCRDDCQSADPADCPLYVLLLLRKPRPALLGAECLCRLPVEAPDLATLLSLDALDITVCTGLTDPLLTEGGLSDPMCPTFKFFITSVTTMRFSIR